MRTISGFAILLSTLGCNDPAQVSGVSSSSASAQTSAFPIVSTGLRRGIWPGAAPSAAAAAPRPLVAALAGPAQLALPGGARVEVPSGATRARPLVIALSEFEPAADHCASWRRVAAYPFVLCLDVPPAAPTSETEGKLQTALNQLKQRFGAHLASGPVVLSGTGVGGKVVVSLARKSPGFFARLLLLGGGLEQLDTGLVRSFAARGGQRMFLMCKTDTVPCQNRVDRHLVALRQAGVTGDELPAHAPAPLRALEPELRQRWAAIVKGDPRWQDPVVGDH